MALKPRPLAYLQERRGSNRISFRFHGKHHFLIIGKVSAEEASAKAAQIDCLLLRLKERLTELPPGLDIVDFAQRDGKPPDLAPAENEAIAPSVARGLGMPADFRDHYAPTHRLECDSVARW